VGVRRLELVYADPRLHEILARVFVQRGVARALD
jgi:hypothetical protein